MLYVRGHRRNPSGIPASVGAFWTVSGIVETFHALIDSEVISRAWAVASGVLSLVAGIVLLAYRVSGW